MAIITGVRVPGCCRIRAEEEAGRENEDPFFDLMRGVMTDPDSKSRASRRRWSRRRVLSVLAAAGAAMVADGLWWEPHRLQVERRPLAFPDLPPGLDGLRLVQLSDLHRGYVVGEREIERAVALANVL